MMLSLAVHVALLALLVYHAAPAFITPSDVGLGIPHSFGSQSIVYLAPVGPERAKALPQQPKLTLRAKVTPKPKPPEPEVKRQETAQATANDAPLADRTWGIAFRSRTGFAAHRR